MGGGSAYAAADDDVKLGNDEENFDGRGGFVCWVDDFLLISFVVKIVMSAPNPRSAAGSKRAFSSASSFDDFFRPIVYYL